MSRVLRPIARASRAESTSWWPEAPASGGRVEVRKAPRDVLDPENRADTLACVDMDVSRRVLDISRACTLRSRRTSRYASVSWGVCDWRSFDVEAEEARDAVCLCLG